MSSVWGGMVGTMGWPAFIAYLSLIGLLAMLAGSDMEVPMPQFISE